MIYTILSTSCLLYDVKVILVGKFIYWICRLDRFERLKIWPRHSVNAESVWINYDTTVGYLKKIWSESISLGHKVDHLHGVFGPVWSLSLYRNLNMPYDESH
jgi:hypothetical protein